MKLASRNGLNLPLHLHVRGRPQVGEVTCVLGGRGKGKGKGKGGGKPGQNRAVPIIS